MARRIRKGFHRIGAVGAVACIAAAFLCLLVPDKEAAAQAFGVWLLVGAVFYGAAAGLGWIVAGFASDDTPAQRG